VKPKGLPILKKESIMATTRNTNEKVVLTSEQKQMVLKELDGQDGGFDIFVEVSDNLTIELDGYVHEEGYRDNDYYFGTGEIVITSRTADVNVTAFRYDEDGNEEVLDVEHEFEKECYEYLQSA
jgi:hypothetical protein